MQNQLDWSNTVPWKRRVNDGVTAFGWALLLSPLGFAWIFPPLMVAYLAAVVVGLWTAFQALSTVLAFVTRKGHAVRNTLAFLVASYFVFPDLPFIPWWAVLPASLVTFVFLDILLNVTIFRWWLKDPQAFPWELVTKRMERYLLIGNGHVPRDGGRCVRFAANFCRRLRNSYDSARGRVHCR
jgi:hypothetical protein